MDVDGVRCSWNKSGFEKKLVNDDIVLDLFIIYQKLQHIQVISKIPYSYVLIDLQNNQY